MELDDKLYYEILDLCDDGNDLVEESDLDGAIDQYLQALALVPAPKNIWEASTWIYTALGDTFFLKEEYTKARDYCYDALNCPYGIDNPFILMRLGQSLQELGEEEKAKEYLLRAYMVEGYGVFYDEDDKYINLIIDLI